MCKQERCHASAWKKAAEGERIKWVCRSLFGCCPIAQPGTKGNYLWVDCCYWCGRNGEGGLHHCFTKHYLTMWTIPFISVRETLHVHLNSWAAFNALHYVEDSGHTLRLCPLYALITALKMVSTASHTQPVGPFSGFVYANNIHLKSSQKPMMRAAAGDLLGHPKLSWLAAASLSRKKNTKRIKECEQRTDETLAIRVCGIRQNAGWQRPVLLFCSLKPRKKSCLFKSETGWQQNASACTHHSEWVTGSISPSAAHVGTSVILSNDLWWPQLVVSDK